MVNVKAHVFVSGIVQGVFFRLATKEQAEIYNVTGWIRNLLDGRVEAVFEGEENNVLKLVEYCHRGPPNAKVTNVEVEWQKYFGEFTSFKAK